MKLYGVYISQDFKQSDEIEIPEKVFLINGYNFGDRLLEDVYFEVKFKGNKVLSVKVEKDSKDYFSELNQKKWLKEAKEYAESVLKTGDEVEVPEYIRAKYPKQNVFYIAK
jgi:hypothetical protein